MKKSQDNDRNRQHSGDPRSDELPWGARFILYLVFLLLAASMIVLPIWSIQRYGATTGSDLWGPMIAALIGLTTMTISGIFVFMTFRIDRGTKLTAQRTASKIATDTVNELVQKVIGERLAEVRNQIDEELSTMPDEVREIAKGLLGKMENDMEKEMETAKNVIIKRFEVLEGKMTNQFAGMTEKIEELFLKANVEELIKQAVNDHLRRDEENTANRNGPEQAG